MEIGFYPGFTKVVALDFNSTSLAWKWIARGSASCEAMPRPLAGMNL